MSRFDKSGDDTTPTRLIRCSGDQEGAGEDATRKLDYPAEASMTGANTGLASGATTEPVSGSPKTVLFRPSQQDADPQASADAEQPVVAWLVVTGGPGRGHALAISYGLNRIGRGADQAVSLPFGDEQISRSHHAAIEYDPKLRAFYLSKGDNLVYLNGARVGSGNEQALNSGDQIELGSTKLRFVAFCGPDFDWND